MGKVLELEGKALPRDNSRLRELGGLFCAHLKFRMIFAKLVNVIWGHIPISALFDMF